MSQAELSEESAAAQQLFNVHASLAHNPFTYISIEIVYSNEKKICWIFSLPFHISLSMLSSFMKLTQRKIISFFFWKFIVQLRLASIRSCTASQHRHTAKWVTNMKENIFKIISIRFISINYARYSQSFGVSASTYVWNVDGTTHARYGKERISNSTEREWAITRTTKRYQHMAHHHWHTGSYDGWHNMFVEILIGWKCWYVYQLDSVETG